MLSFMRLAKGDSPHLRFLSPYEDASFSPVSRMSQPRTTQHTQLSFESERKRDRSGLYGLTIEVSGRTDT